MRMCISYINYTNLEGNMDLENSDWASGGNGNGLGDHANMDMSSDDESIYNKEARDGNDEFYDALEYGVLQDGDNDSLVHSEFDSSDNDFDEDENEEENMEAMLGEIPNNVMGVNPIIDLAFTFPLYDGCVLSMLYATLLIMNCGRTHAVSNTFINELQGRSEKTHIRVH